MTSQSIAAPPDRLAQDDLHYRALFDSIDQGFCVVEVLFDDGTPVDYRFLEVNGEFERQTGLHDAVGRTMRDLRPDHESHWFDIYGRVALTGEPVRFRNPARALGRWYEAYAFRTGHPSQRRVGILFRDVSAEVREREAVAKTERLKDEFLAMLSHELRNPLSAIRNAAEVLRMPHLDETTRTHASEIVARQSRIMHRLLDDLLDISRLNLGRLTLDRTTVPLASVIESAVETTRPLMQAAGHTLEVAMPPPWLTVDADAVRLGQALSNLLANAAKYTPHGGRIDLQVEVRPAEAVISVEDNGIGIEPQALEAIFELFAQGGIAAKGANASMGIGLALVRRIVELHGGWVRAASGGPGLGSRFDMGLPRAG